jgi:hypothetical protein
MYFVSCSELQNYILCYYFNFPESGTKRTSTAAGRELRFKESSLSGSAAPRIYLRLI